MPYAALMVHFDAAPSAHRRVHLAVHLANWFQAAMIGIAGRPYVPTLMAEGLTIDLEEADCGQDELAILADIGREFHAATRHVRHTGWGETGDVSIWLKTGRRIRRHRTGQGGGPVGG